MSQPNESKVFDGSTQPQAGPRSPKEPLDGQNDGTGTLPTDGGTVEGESMTSMSVTAGPHSPKEPL
jgi:hypothetical protein